MTDLVAQLTGAPQWTTIRKNLMPAPRGNMGVVPAVGSWNTSFPATGAPDGGSYFRATKNGAATVPIGDLVILAFSEWTDESVGGTARVKPGTTYAMSLYIRSSLAIPQLEVQAQSVQGSGPGTAPSPQFSPSTAVPINTWTYVGLVFTTPASGMPAVRFDLNTLTSLNFPNGATLDIANILIEENSGFDNWFSGDSFPHATTDRVTNPRGVGLVNWVGPATTHTMTPLATDGPDGQAFTRVSVNANGSGEYTTIYGLPILKQTTYRGSMWIRTDIPIPLAINFVPMAPGPSYTGGEVFGPTITTTPGKWQKLEVDLPTNSDTVSFELRARVMAAHAAYNLDISLASVQQRTRTIWENLSGNSFSLLQMAVDNPLTIHEGWSQEESATPHVIGDTNGETRQTAYTAVAGPDSDLLIGNPLSVTGALDSYGAILDSTLQGDHVTASSYDVDSMLLPRRDFPAVISGHPEAAIDLMQRYYGQGGVTLPWKGVGICHAYYPMRGYSQGFTVDGLNQPYYQSTWGDTITIDGVPERSFYYGRDAVVPIFYVRLPWGTFARSVQPIQNPTSTGDRVNYMAYRVRLANSTTISTKLNWQFVGSALSPDLNLRISRTTGTSGTISIDGTYRQDNAGSNTTVTTTSVPTTGLDMSKEITFVQQWGYLSTALTGATLRVKIYAFDQDSPPGGAPSVVIQMDLPNAMRTKFVGNNSRIERTSGLGTDAFGFRDVIISQTDNSWPVHYPVIPEPSLVFCDFRKTDVATVSVSPEFSIRRPIYPWSGSGWDYLKMLCAARGLDARVQGKAVVVRDIEPMAATFKPRSPGSIWEWGDRWAWTRTILTTGGPQNFESFFRWTAPSSQSTSGRGWDIYGNHQLASPGVTADWTGARVVAGEPVTVTTWVRSSVATSFTIDGREHNGFGLWLNAGRQLVAPVAVPANTWTKIEGTFTPLSTGYMSLGVYAVDGGTYPLGGTIDGTRLTINYNRIQPLSDAIDQPRVNVVATGRSRSIDVMANRVNGLAVGVYDLPNYVANMSATVRVNQETSFLLDMPPGLYLKGSMKVTITDSEGAYIDPVNFYNRSARVTPSVTENGLLAITVRGPRGEYDNIGSGPWTITSIEVTNIGFYYDQQKLTLYTGAPENMVTREKGSDVDNPFLNSQADVYNRGTWLITSEGSPALTLTFAIPEAARSRYPVGQVVSYGWGLYRVMKISHERGVAAITAEWFAAQASQTANWLGKSAYDWNTYWSERRGYDVMIRPLASPVPISDPQPFLRAYPSESKWKR